MPYVPPASRISPHEAAETGEDPGLPSMYLYVSKVVPKQSLHGKGLHDHFLATKTLLHMADGLAHHEYPHHSKDSNSPKKSAAFPCEDNVQDNDDDVDNDDEYEHKPYRQQRTRKLSDEFIRPSLRPLIHVRSRSVPDLSSKPKIVHFDEKYTESRWFFRTDCPSAIIATPPLEEDIFGDSSTDEDDEDCLMFLQNKSFPKELKIQSSNLPPQPVDGRPKPVFLEGLLFSSESKTIRGCILVQNLAFEKKVTARFTLDNWQTTSEVSAEYDHDQQSNGSDYDRFRFSIDMADRANLGCETLQLYIYYLVDGQKYWDNNHGPNFVVTFQETNRVSERVRLSERYNLLNSLNAVGRVFGADKNTIC